MYVRTYVSMYILNTSNTVERSVQMALLAQRGSPFILHSLTCLSSAAEASRGSVGWKATQFTPRSWPWGALRSRKRSERTTQTAGCLKQPVQQTCSSVSPSLHHHTVSTMHAAAYNHPPTLSSSSNPTTLSPPPPHSHYVRTYLTCTTSHTYTISLTL